MGSYRPLKAAKYTSETLNEMKESLAESVRKKIISDDINYVKIKHLTPTLRKKNLEDFKQGYGADYGFVRIFSLAEACGLRIEMSVKGLEDA